MSTSAPRPSASLGLILFHAFASAILMWCVWLLTHLPGVDVHPAFRASLMLSVLIVTSGIAGRASHGRETRAFVLGAGIGTVTALLNLLILGSELTEQPATTDAVAPGLSGLRPELWIFVPGFVFFLSLLSGASALAARRLAPRSGDEPTDWFGRFSLVHLAAFLPLLLIGSLVTTTDSGMAVPDWPNSYGANMFLYPIALMSDPSIFLEHTHRLFGSLLGLTTLALAALAWLTRAPARSRTVALILFVAVCVQGYLGATRVLADVRGIGAVHGFLAHAIFAASAAFAAWLSPLHQALPRLTRANRPRVLVIATTAFLHTTLLQTLVGSFYRHLRLDESMGKGVGHILYMHIALALVVVVLGAMAGFRALAASREAGNAPHARPLARFGLALVVCVILQFMLGWGAFFAISEEGASWAPVIRTLHHANGAALLGVAAGLVVRAKRVPKTTA